MDKNTKVLLVEDDHFLREMYHHTFTKAGYVVDLAKNGEEAVRLAESEKYDVVLLDIMMPKKNGIEALHDMRQDTSPAKDTPVILLTNLGQEEVIREAFKLGANGFILKADMLPHQVEEKVTKFLNGEIKKEDFLPSQSTE